MHKYKLHWYQAKHIFSTRSNFQANILLAKRTIKIKRKHKLTIFSTYC
jgi:hypothetical protein